MRIGIFDPYLDDLGGGEKYMVTIAECLSKKHEVFVFWDNQKDIDLLLQRFPIDLSKVSITKNIFARDFGFLQRISESRKFDVIFVLSDGSIPLIFPKKLFIHLQQPIPGLSLTFKTKLKKLRVNEFFCNSHFTKGFVDKEFAVNSKVIYPPVEIVRAKTKKENIILNVGRFRVKDVTTLRKGKKEGVGDYKKQSIMVNVFKEMVDKGLKDWEFVIAVSIKEDEKKQFEEMRKLANGYPVKFIVNSPNQALGDIYFRSKIYWHASGFGEDLKLHPEFAEHFGISTVEAMSAGAVPVVINAGGQKEIVKEGETGFLWNTLEELKSKTLRLISDDKELSGFSEKAALFAEGFNKEKFCREINELILQ